MTDAGHVKVRRTLRATFPVDFEGSGTSSLECCLD